jgi:uncharacterized protein YjbJ (UPF0337 family)
MTMNWDQVQSSWPNYASQAKVAFAKLTDADIAEAAGNREKLEGAIQKRYGYAKEEAKTHVDKWVATLH